MDMFIPLLQPKNKKVVVIFYLYVTSITLGMPKNIFMFPPFITLSKII